MNQNDKCVCVCVYRYVSSGVFCMYLFIYLFCLSVATLSQISIPYAAGRSAQHMAPQKSIYLLGKQRQRGGKVIRAKKVIKNWSKKNEIRQQSYKELKSTTLILLYLLPHEMTQIILNLDVCAQPIAIPCLSHIANMPRPFSNPSRCRRVPECPYQTDPAHPRGLLKLKWPN